MIGTAVLTLSEFVLARIDEDEAAALALIADANEWAAADLSGPTRDEEYAGLNIGAGRVVADCKVRRRIVRRAGNYSQMRTGGPDARRMMEATVRDLASVYAHHPDYNPDWRPA